jgi:hypothetical protein
VCRLNDGPHLFRWEHDYSCSVGTKYGTFEKQSSTQWDFSIVSVEKHSIDYNEMHEAPDDRLRMHSYIDINVHCVDILARIAVETARVLPTRISQAKTR